MQNNSWARLRAYVTGLVNQRLLLQCEYLIAENRILRSHVSGRVRIFGCGALHARRNRQAARAEVSSRIRLHCQARNDPGLVSLFDRVLLQLGQARDNKRVQKRRRERNP